MSTATTNIELDFFAMENNHHSKSHSHNLFRRQRSLKDIQSSISKIKPEILRSVITSGCADDGKHDVIATNHNPSLSPKGGNGDHFFQFHSLPVYSPSNSRMSSLENLPDTAPLTIFYNETVTVFHVSRDQAKSIIKVAEKGSIISKSEVEKAIPLNELQQMGYAANEELPLARKRSLQRFLEKRKERLILPWPYACHI